MIKERWSPVQNTDEVYWVSTRGRIMSYSFMSPHGKVLKTSPNSITGYCRIRVYKNKIGTQQSVHRLVALAFIENPNNYTEINHINGIKTDNRIDNLEWCSRGHNIKHSFQLGLNKAAKGESHIWCKISEKIVFDILNHNESDKKTGILFGVSASCVNKIRTGRNWSQITGLPKKV